MNKSAIEKFAIESRVKLIEGVTQKAFEYGIERDKPIDKGLTSLYGIVFEENQIKKRLRLIEEIENKGFDETIEQVAYTWFNRFIAIRYMEVNNYLPSGIQVFSDNNGEFKPQILIECNNDEFELLDKNGKNILDKKIISDYRNSQENKEEELFRYLLISQCKELNALLPKMFDDIGVSDFTDLLLPNNLLGKNGVLAHLINDIEESDFTVAVEILGWLYQFYNTDKKDETFAKLKKNVKITKENIPAATQLFTPDWIVKYMVENSLGKIGVEKLKIDPVAVEWKYYLDEAEQTAQVQEQLKAISDEQGAFNIEEIKIIDPCMGSGHILVYVFDVLVEMYKHLGYQDRDAVASIIENNLYGLDIDSRAYQLAYFAVMMKARKYDRRFFTRGLEPQLYCPEGYADGEEYGSLVIVDKLEEAPSDDKGQVDLNAKSYETRLNTWNFRRLLCQKYDVVVTNPPYMGGSGMSGTLSNYVKKYYADSKSDLSTCFMEKSLSMCKETGYITMINIPVWMFLSSYEKLRKNILNQNTLSTMLHFGRGVFGSDFGSVGFVIGKQHIKGYLANYRKLFPKQGAVDSVEQKEKWFFEKIGQYVSTKENFSKIPGSPIAYWVSDKMLEAFENGQVLGEIADSKQGIATADNNTFLRLWSEVDINKSCFNATSVDNSMETKKKWFPYNKGGEFRKWYGNNDFVVNWENDGLELKKFKKSVLRNPTYYFRECFSWSLISSSVAGFRYKPQGHLFDVAGMSCFTKKDFNYLLALCNTSFAMEVLKIIAPTINYQCGDIANIPVIIDNSKKSQVEEIVQQNIDLSKLDWDSFETSWDFLRHPLATNTTSIETAFNSFKENCNNSFHKLKANEEELNRIFIDIYGLQDELTPDVSNKDVTIHRVFNHKDDVPLDMKGSSYILTYESLAKSFISYAVGCMFGRYSLDKDGLAFAGGDFDINKYSTFIPDDDNIIPINDEDYFEDDIVNYFVEFVKVVFGEDTLEENLNFIVTALGKNGYSRDVLRTYFLNDFFKDHCKTYKKRPIYWLVESGKKNGFKALIYLHRYNKQTLGIIRTNYVHKLQNIHETTKKQYSDELLTAPTQERNKINKLNKKLTEQQLEISEFEEILKHLSLQNISIDLDDGVKNNYELFSGILAKIK